MNNQDIVKEELAYEEELDGLMKIRKEKLEELQKEGKNPFDITKYDRTDYAKEIVENFNEDVEKNVSVAGRIMTKRVMGKASFFNLQDETGKIQVYISLNDVEDKYLDFKKYDLGDIVGVKGFVFKTKTGEISIHAKDIVLLTKTLRPFPDKFKEYLNERGYLEVETPILHKVAGGAAARPFETHHNTLDMDMYLRIANELYLKRLIVGGFRKSI